MATTTKFKPFEHQLNAQKDLQRMDKCGGGFLCDMMGLGKTLTMSMFLIDNHIDKTQNLIVCPYSLLTIWSRELKKADGWNSKSIKPKILVYHGSSRKKYINKLNNYDFVITTYAIISSRELDFKKWQRTILDESHAIKNGLQRSAPKCAQAAYHLGQSSKSRFCITGTPFNNRIKDIASQAKFVGVAPYNDPNWWEENGSNEQNILCWRNKFVIRRTKDGMISKPNYNDIITTPTKQEEKLINILREQAAEEFKNWKKARTSGDNFTRIQLQGKILGLIQKLRIYSNSYYVGEGNIDVDDALNNCAKTERIISDLDRIVFSDPKKGVVVFSQFTSYLDVLEQIIEEVMVGVKVMKFTGDLNKDKRDIIINKFNKSRQPRIILVSLMAGGVGVSLHHGSSTVVLCEPYYNPFMEAQAEERVHRLGQQHQVNVYRYRMSNSVESWINSLKEKKLTLAGSLELVKQELVPIDFDFNDIAELFREHVAFIKNNEEEKPKEPEIKQVKIADRVVKVKKGQKINKVPKMKKR